MKKFLDAEGRPWSVAVNVNTLKRVREMADVNLLDVVDGRLTERLAADPELLVNVLWAAVEPAARAATPPVTAEQFGEAMAGDALDAATAALLEDLADFFPKGKREALRAVLAKANLVQARAAEVALARINDLDVDRLLEQMSGGSVTSSPASSASTPAASPSAS